MILVSAILLIIAEIKLDFIPLDLSSFESIEEFVKQLKSKNYKVDLLVNNAGLMFTEYSLTKGIISDT